jgi:hypothetical protein
MSFARWSIWCVALGIALAGCQRSPESRQPRKAEKPRAAVIDPQVFNLLQGVVMTERSGEQEPATSALMAIDGDLTSSWVTPHGDPQQHCTLSFPARTRIESVGIANRFVSNAARAAGRIELEWSGDGTTFQLLETIATSQVANDQSFGVQPAEAIALRATILGTIGKAETAELPELIIRGREMETPLRGSLDGTWKVNQLTARLAEDGSYIFGATEQDPPMLIDGAWSGRYGRFAWIRGKQYGVGFLTLDRSGNHLNALWWFEEAITPYLGMPWFGTRTGSTLPPINSEFADRSLQDRKKVPLYQISFDPSNRLTGESLPALDRVGELVSRHPDKQFRIVAHEVRGTSPQADQRATEAQIASLRAAFAARTIDTSRITFLAAGSTLSRDPTAPPIYYALLHSRVELEVIEE